MSRLRRKRPKRLWRMVLYVRQHREARNISVSELARQIGKTKSMVSQIENGRSAASLETLVDIAECFRLEHAGLLFEPPVPHGWVRVPDPNSTTR